MEIIITDPNGLERRQFRLVLLNEIMLQTALARRFKNPLPVDDPLAYGCKSLARRWTGGRRRIMFPFILNVQKRKPPGVFVHVSDGVVSGPRDPEAIHFKIHKGGIGMLNQVIERNHVPEFFKVPVVIVIGETDAGLFAPLAGLVQEVGRALISVNRVAQKVWERR